MPHLHPSVRVVVLLKAEQLSLFGGGGPTKLFGGRGGPTKQVHVKPHTRMTSHGIEQVTAHERMAHTTTTPPRKVEAAYDAKLDTMRQQVRDLDRQLNQHGQVGHEYDEGELMRRDITLPDLQHAIDTRRSKLERLARPSDKLPAPMTGAPDKDIPVKTLGPFDFPPFGMVSARAKYHPDRRSQHDDHQSTVTVYWHNHNGEPQAATFDPMAGRSGEWQPAVRGSAPEAPALVSWALRRLGVRPLPASDPEIDASPSDFLAYAYLNQHKKLDDDMVSSLQKLPG